MEAELIEIKNKIINKTYLIIIILLVPTYIFSILRVLDMGWNLIFTFQSLSFVFFAVILTLRNKLKFLFKIHSIIAFASLQTIMASLTFGLSGGLFYFLLVIFISSILLGKKTGIVYFLVLSSFMLIIAFIISFHIFKIKADLNIHNQHLTAWFSYLSGLFGVSLIIIFTASDLYSYFGLLIKEKLRKENELIASESLLQSIVNNTPALIFLKNQQGQVKFINQKFRDVFGIYDDVKGKTDSELFGEELGKKFREDDLRIISHQKTEELEESLVLEGKNYAYMTRKVPIRSQDGSFDLLGISLDISERKKAELDLQRSERRLQHALYATSDSIWEWNYV